MSAVKQSVADPQAAAGEAFEAIRTFLSTSPEIKLGNVIDRDTPLLQGGALDSLGILQLMMFLGQKLQIEVLDEDLAPENFETVGNLAAFVMRKKSG